MTTLAQIRAIVREVLADTTQWPDATLNVWINQAIRDYSHYFPDYATEAIPCVTDDTTYALGATYAAGIISLIRVEYPDGETPPRYLQRLNDGSQFFLNGPYYDIRGDPPEELRLGESPTTGEYVEVSYTKAHKALSANADATTVPDRHLEALSIFCVWKAAEEIFATEEIDPDTREFLVSQMGLNAIRYERIYRNKIAEYQSGSASERSGPWGMDKYGQVY